jgi:signal transduction histidine kinase
MPISAEFIGLCQAQISLLTQSGATLSAVYLTQELVDEGSQAQLVAIAAYPDSQSEQESSQRPFLPPFSTSPPEITLATQTPQSPLKGMENLPMHSWADHRQIVLPLLHNDVMLGVLVTRRDDRPWYTWEHSRIEQVANTLTIACVLDQRYQWLAHEHQQERLVYRQQHDVMDNLIHQLRNSLTALQTFGKLILKRLLPGDSNQELATSLVRETDRLKDLAQQLEQVLNLQSRGIPALPPAGDNSAVAFNAAVRSSVQAPAIETQAIPLLPSSGLGGSPLVLELCLVDTVLNPLIASARAIAQENQITLHAQISDDLPPIWANAQGLREVFNNLIENALKYTPAGGEVFITADTNADESWVTVIVTDTGVGIPAQDLPRLFERHFRGVQAEGLIPGSGLGLAIAHMLIEQMHGKIEVFSPAYIPNPQTPNPQTPNPQSNPQISETAAFQQNRSSNPGTTFLVQFPTEPQESY